MQPSDIYALTLAGLLVVASAFRLAATVSQARFPQAVRWALKHFVYPHFYRRTLGMDPPARYQALLQATYCAGTLACNIAGLDSVTDAGLRASRISVANLVPLAIASPLGYAADLVGLTVPAFARLHGCVAVMMAVQASFHVATVVAEHRFKSEDPVHFTGLLVRSHVRYHENHG